MTATKSTRRYAQTYRDVEVFTYLRDGLGSVRVPQPAGGPAASRQVGKVERVEGGWEARSTKGAVEAHLGTYPTLSLALFRFASDEADRLHRQAEAAKVQGGGSVVDTFTRRRLTWEDVQARLALSPLHSQRVVLVASVWGDWKGLTPFTLLGAPEPGPGGRKVLHLRNTYDDRVLAIWEESRLYGTSEDD